jgi:NTP pyrophosphatase (non-canonical NTP hydrolase)
MQYSRETAGRMQLDEYVAEIVKIYGAHDRHRSLWDVWCHALHHAAAIAERLRKKAPAAEVFNEIADFALWLFTAVHKLEGRLGEPHEPNETPPETLIRIRTSCSDLLWHRYPKVCPFCYARRTGGGSKSRETQELLRPCDCQIPDSHEPKDKVKKGAKKRATAESLHNFSEKTRSEKPKNIDEWQEMFAAVFSTSLRKIPLAEVALRLMEELGEASDAMVRMYSYREDNFLKGEPRQRQLRLESQIADVFSWLFALVEIFGLLSHEISEYDRWRSESTAATPGPIRLSEIIWRRYGSDEQRSFYCPSCEHATCSCPLIFVPPTRSVEEFKTLLNDHDRP